MTLVALVLAVPAALFAATLAGAAVIAARHRPTGRFADVDGLRVHHRVTGPEPEDGVPPVVVIHGASGNLEEPLLGLGAALAHRRVVWVDRPGHGHTPRGGSGMHSPAAQARVVAGLMDRLGLDRAVVVGHSWGGSVAAAMGVLHGRRVAGIVFVAPATHPWPGGVAWYNEVARLPLIGALFAWTVPLPVGLLVLRRAARAVFAPDPMPEDYPRRARVAMLLRPWTFRANCEDIAGLNAAVAALSPRYPEITAPVAIVTGDTDSVVAPRLHAEGLARDIPAAELDVLAGAGHMPHHAHAAAVARAVDRVIARAAIARVGGRAARSG